MSARAQMAKFKTQAESRNRDVRALRSEDGTWQIRVRNTDQFSPESDVISTLDTDDKYLVIPMGMIPPDVPCLIKMETVPFGWRSGVDEDNLNNASVDIRCLQAIRFDSQTVVLNPSSPVNSSVSSRTKVIVTDSDVWKMTIGHWATKAWLNGFSWGSNTDQDTIRCGEAAMKHGVSDLLIQLNSWKNDTRLTDVRIRFAAGTLTLSTGQKAVHAGWQLDGIPSTVPPSYSGDYPTAIIPLQALPSQRPHVPAEALGIQLNYEAHPTQSHTFNAPYHKRYYISRPSTGANTASVWAVQHSIPMWSIPLEERIHDEHSLTNLLMSYKQLWKKAYASMLSPQTDSWSRHSPTPQEQVINHSVKNAIDEIVLRLVTTSKSAGWTKENWGKVLIAAGGFALPVMGTFPQDIYSAYKILYDGKFFANCLDEASKLRTMSLYA